MKWELQKKKLFNYQNENDMKAKQLIIAALLLAAIAPMKAQDWNRLNDTTWVSYTLTKNGVITDYAYQVDQSQLLAIHNNTMRTFGFLELGCMASEGIAVLATLQNARKFNNQSKGLKAASIIFGLAGLGMGIAGVSIMVQDKVYLTPEGIIIKIGKTDSPKYDNKKQRKRTD